MVVLWCSKPKGEDRFLGGPRALFKLVSEYVEEKGLGSFNRFMELNK